MKLMKWLDDDGFTSLRIRIITVPPVTSYSRRKYRWRDDDDLTALKIKTIPIPVVPPIPIISLAAGALPRYRRKKPDELILLIKKYLEQRLSYN